MRYLVKKMLFYVMLIIILLTGIISGAQFYSMIKNGEKMELPEDYLF